RLLRVLEHHEVQPAGSLRPSLVDVRIIAATSRDLYREIGRGVFRDDLYYGLSAATVRLPPLRERSSDIGLLATYFLAQHSRRGDGGRARSRALPAPSRSLRLAQVRHPRGLAIGLAAPRRRSVAGPLVHRTRSSVLRDNFHCARALWALRERFERIVLRPKAI